MKLGIFSAVFLILAVMVQQPAARGDDFSAEAVRVLTAAEKVPGKSKDITGPVLDRTRGQIVFPAEEARYEKGAHSGKWTWPEFTGDRWGSYRVHFTYASLSPRQGFQFFIGPHKAKGYLGATGSLESFRTTVLGRIRIPDRKTYPVGILSGEESNRLAFLLRQVVLEPAPEEESPCDQAIDGTVTLPAKAATPYGRYLRYDGEEGKHCLAHWTDPKDWVEWSFSLHEGGKFHPEIRYGCDEGNQGSEVAIWIDEARSLLRVDDTGGYQSWKLHRLGEVELTPGAHRIVIQPVSQSAGEIVRLKEIALTPVSSGS